MKSATLTLVATAALVFSSWSTAGPLGVAQSTSNQSLPDNSKQNHTQGKTADNQPDAKADRLLTAKVRKAIIADKDLSMYAHNVKIITMNGAVTLKGPVKSDEEKQKVAAAAASAVSSDKITNELTVKQ